MLCWMGTVPSLKALYHTASKGTARRLLGRNVFDYIHPEDASTAIKAFTSGLEEPTGTSGEMEVRFRHKDGSWRRFWGVGMTMLDYPAVRGIILNSRDVTER
jgi:PAS domain S-box-containing protein